MILVNMDTLRNIREAEEEDTTSSSNTKTEEETTDGNENNNDQEEQTETSEENNEADDDQENEIDMSPDNEDNDDFSIDSTDDATEEDTGSDETTEDTGDGSEENEESPEDDTKAKYDALYSTLTDKEKINKDLKLKENFKDLYDIISDLTKKINQIPNTSDNINILKRIISQLNDLKKYIEYYITKIYSTKSFIENTIEFNKFLAIYNGINNIFTDFEKLMIENR